ncbi:hypothetical protein [Marinoscillum furvescens]|uniref:ASCH domain-containing protein n=1 Tax=Marinoscillum furvescens DSM 4134 TaxID=1122208 RepID=A0A3D9L8D2_MARFU|nr:hypothetical protein [Marinoscillum furvescens]REE01127.1 hypothetical protein C7460_104147 [Marinoscillum furvescens DSM 4134]
MERALIIKKVWLDKIFDEGKVWEMRSSRTQITGKIGLIESGSGLILGEAELTGCSQLPIPKDKGLIKYHHIEDLDMLDKWKYAWFLSRARRFHKPIPYHHPPGAVIWVRL